MLAALLAPMVVGNMRPELAAFEAPAVAVSAELEEALDTATQGVHVPGGVVLLSYPDGTAEAAAWGQSDLELGTAMQPGDLLRAGSVTKTYMAVLALKLAAEGYFSLDDPAANYVRPDNHYLRLAADPQAVTIRHLLGHQSGIPDTLAQLRDSVPWLLDLLDGDGRIRNSLPQLAGDGTQFAPGDSCRYSNTGYLLLGEVLEAATGRKVGALLREYVLDPAGLGRTYYAASERTPPQARGYIYADGTYADVTVFDRPELAGPAGAMLADAADLADFARALFEDVTDEGSALLEPDQLAAMTAFHEMEGGGEYGLGLMRFTIDGRTAWGHSGATVGYRAELCYFPDTGLIAIALANCGQAKLKNLIDRVLDARGE